MIERRRANDTVARWDRSEKVKELSERHNCTQTNIPMNWPANVSVVQITQNDSYLATIIQLTYSHTFLFIVRFRKGSISLYALWHLSVRH